MKYECEKWSMRMPRSGKIMLNRMQGTQLADKVVAKHRAAERRDNTF